MPHIKGWKKAEARRAEIGRERHVIAQPASPVVQASASPVVQASSHVSVQASIPVSVQARIERLENLECLEKS